VKLNCCSYMFLHESYSVCSVNIVTFLLKYFKVKADIYSVNGTLAVSAINKICN